LKGGTQAWRERTRPRGGAHRAMRRGTLVKWALKQIQQAHIPSKRAAKKKGTNPKEDTHFKENLTAKLEMSWLL